MKTSLLTLATAAALALATPLHAQEATCLDEACSLQSLLPADTASTTVGGDMIIAPRMGPWGVDTAGMDRSIKPGADFFGYVSGNWAKTTKIPADRSSYGGFAVLRDLSEARVRKLVESYPAADPASGIDAAKVGTLYRGFMDEATIEKLGATPLKPHLAAIRSAKTREDIAKLMGASNAGFGSSFFGLGVSDDARDPEHYALYIGQSGLGLGDRDLYLDPKFAPQREHYQKYIEQMLGMAGWDKPAQRAVAVMALETKIAQAHWTRAESRDRDKTYNPMATSDLAAKAPGFPWQSYLAAAGVDKTQRIIARQNTAVPKLAAIFAATDIDTLKAYEAFHTVDQAAPMLSKAFVDANFDFRAKFMNGQPQQRERWKRAVGFAEGSMGEAIGRDYVKMYFPAESKAKMDALVANMKDALRVRLQNLSWMSPATKTEALAKLDNFGLKIGYPGKWRDYSGLKVVAGDVFGNAERAAQFEWNYDRNRIGQAVDKGEWGMTPQTVNAYYNSVKNEIVFPAAILQPPFFDPDADPAVNYGGIGAVIGHEIIHGFDDQGRKSDGKGMLRDWWTKDDAAKFEVQAAKLGAQYEGYDFAALPGVHINGKASMGENIGDLGGVTVALDAYHRSLGGKPAPVIDGFTGDQRFFLGWGQVWRTLTRDDALRQQLVGDPHSPGQIRAFAPLRNVDAWYDAFGITKGDALYVAPEDRVRIW
ncbi:M13 family metallopeptidase [Cognatilysobacter lacus]|uniref:Peptidase M13 n=1 Tax=Cognatilysobacter lacus TaxID=1643323 RepID=A0A5D8ZBN5_9GAMM|nr:M13-type metalloendopeptidase [Lysobacter lacus]TZF91532.1 peptidase M13 [Lysobacter lacus]